ncbi:hypothetical protein GUJ93_ZPchr0006g40582 [Zizania palustris]|uniref:non-specific serine/threonine protein kinase n=1 Tax=Zizania palustris TaxID=103762 RepID=A0A8J5VHS3_ZIZPA|nr:hypothetical protein GUJ93_ZPchr0006g40582 [Zizania palustris]
MHTVAPLRLRLRLGFLFLFVLAPRPAALAASDRAALLAFRASLSPPSRAALASWRGPLSASWLGVSLHPPASTGAAPPSVAELALPGLNLSGQLPAAPLALLRRLRALDLSSNVLSGELPCSLPRTLLDLDLSRNALFAAVPTCLPASLPALRSLNLSANALRFPLSPRLSFPASLTALDLSHNALAGSVPPRIVADPDASNLLLLDLSHNRFSGEIPAGITAIRSLQGLFLADNQLSGEIPIGIGNLTYLQALDLSHNRLSGIVPAGLAGCFQLLYLQLGGNRLSGALRPELDALDSLKVLDLSNNRISGEIPLPLAGCRSLEVVNLSGNKITGELSGAVAKWQSLRFLSLAGNQLSGQLPDWMFSFPTLQWLDLSCNKFVGFIPDGGFNVSVVFNGRGGGQGIPSEAVLPPELFVSATMDMPGRQLELGYDLQAATSIDLSRNELRGEIPEGLVSMKGLQYLNLSCNYLDGQIPSGVGGMGRLQTLDFSHNGLSGEVPPGIAAMTELEVLNLSYNSLSGPLPTTDGLQKFPGALAGNPGICSGEGCSADARMPEGKREGSNRHSWLGGWHRENGWVSLAAFCISTMTSFYVSLATLLCSPKARNFVFRPASFEQSICDCMYAKYYALVTDINCIVAFLCISGIIQQGSIHFLSGFMGTDCHRAFLWDFNWKQLRISICHLLKDRANTV